MSSLMVFNTGYIVINIDIVWLQKPIIPTKLWTQAILKFLEECTKLQIANFSVYKFSNQQEWKEYPHENKTQVPVWEDLLHKWAWGLVVIFERVTCMYYM